MSSLSGSPVLIHLLARLRRWLVASWSFACRLTAPDIRDVFLVVGLGLLFYGLWQVWQPLPYIVVGALLIWLALLEPSPAASVPHSGQEKRLRHGAR